MKKIISITLAISMLIGLTACGSQEIDPYENVSCKLSTPEYPTFLSATLDMKESPYKYNIKHHLSIEQAGIESVTVKVTVAEAESKDYLDKNSYMLKSDTYVYEIPLNDIETQFISEDFFYKNEEKILDGFKDELSEEADLYKLYFSLPPEDINFAEGRNQTEQLTTENLILEEDKINKSPKYGVYAVYKSSNDKLHLVYTVPFFINGEILANTYYNTRGSYYDEEELYSEIEDMVGTTSNVIIKEAAIN